MSQNGQTLLRSQIIYMEHSKLKSLTYQWTFVYHRGGWRESERENVKDMDRAKISQKTSLYLERLCMYL